MRAALVLACLCSCAPIAVAPRKTSVRAEPSPSYQTLDGHLHYYAITRIEPFADHYSSTFFRVEGAYCTLLRVPGQLPEIDGCGWPASLTEDDRVPPDREFLLPYLRAAVLAQEPGSSGVHVSFEGAYRRVFLEEEIPCDGKHGNGYSRVELRYDAELRTIDKLQFREGSACGASPFYWASASPQWLSFTSLSEVLGMNASLPLPHELELALQDRFAHPEEGANPPRAELWRP